MDRQEAVSSGACAYLLALGRAFCIAVLSLGFSSNWTVHPALGTAYAGSKVGPLGTSGFGLREGCLLAGVSAPPANKA